jgi:hypothetical protein
MHESYLDLSTGSQSVLSMPLRLRLVGLRGRPSFDQPNHRQITKFGSQTEHFSLTFQKVMFYASRGKDGKFTLGGNQGPMQHLCKGI